ncbi:MAG: type I-E CRISPR-associated protein Cse1/CasA [Clostridia bacterium]|nr:type I-E CRISPR-associated protein Cse1/CasA [Clostridia bacterium]
MADKEFNLLYEPWVRVMRSDATVEEISLLHVLTHAHEYRSLAGEMPTQDIAMLRLLLAVLHAVFTRVDEHGDPAPLKNMDNALDRWQALWERGSIPAKPVEDYLQQYEDRFWLFHPERPFWQAKSAEIGTEYAAAKLNGEMSESSNKLRLFPVRTGEAKRTLTYSEAARWLLYVNGFDDTSAKPKGKDLPAVGAGWLGKLGLIWAKGNNLFETLMLNLVLINAEEQEPWQSAIPVWELPVPREQERVQIVLKPDQAALLTMQSRRLLLDREDGSVTGFRLLGGDFFERKNAFAEQMTMWRPIIEKKAIVGYQPVRHDPARKLWREFSALTEQSVHKGHCPGIITWHRELIQADVLEKRCFIAYQIAAAQYGDKDFFVTDTFSDGIAFQAGILTELGTEWREVVADEVKKCESAAYYVGQLALHLRKAAGGAGKGEEADSERAKAEFFFRVDEPFRQWLMTLDAEQEEPQRLEAEYAWQETLRHIALNLGRELAEAAGLTAYRGHTVMESKTKGKDKEAVFYSTPKAWGRYQGCIYALTEGREADAST